MSDIAIVEPDHLEVMVDELVTEIVRYGHHLGAEADDDQDRRIVWIAEGLVAETDLPDGCELFAQLDCSRLVPVASASAAITGRIYPSASLWSRWARHSI